MAKRGALIAVAIGLLGVTSFGGAAEAQQGGWCAVGGGRNAYQNCYYYTFQQCLAAVSGVGGTCSINPSAGRRSGLWWEDEQDEPPRRPRRRSRRY